MHLDPYKPKIGRQQSFAIGARDLSESLNGIPQEGHMQLAFRGAQSEDDGAHLVMTFRYAHEPRLARLGGPPSWTVWVSAVPREFKGRVKALLIGEALPKIARPWLFARAGLLGRAGEEALDLVFDHTEDKILGRPGLRNKGVEPTLIRTSSC